VSIHALKQVIIANAEHALLKAKLASQVAHAAVAAFLEAAPVARAAWLRASMPKVVLKAASEPALQELHRPLLCQDKSLSLLLTRFSELSFNCLQ